MLDPVSSFSLPVSGGIARRLYFLLTAMFRQSGLRYSDRFLTCFARYKKEEEEITTDRLMLVTSMTRKYVKFTKIYASIILSMESMSFLFFALSLIGNISGSRIICGPIWGSVPFPEPFAGL